MLAARLVQVGFASGKDTFRREPRGRISALPLDITRAGSTDTFIVSTGTSRGNGFRNSESGNGMTKRTDPHHTVIDHYWLFDPRRAQQRVFQVADGTMVSNVEKDVVIFECDSYRKFTDANEITRLVVAALGTVSHRGLLLSIERFLPRTVFAIPIGWTVTYDSPRLLRIYTEHPSGEAIYSFVEKHLDSGYWTFASRKANVPAVKELDRSIRFETELPQAQHWSFVITIDLDGMLLGFIEAGSTFDAFRAGMWGAISEGH